jgi:hypothetical protein
MEALVQQEVGVQPFLDWERVSLAHIFLVGNKIYNSLADS